MTLYYEKARTNGASQAIEKGKSQQ